MGNARAITGVAFIDGDEYASVEYDGEGRPERLATTSAVVRLFDYDASSVTVETTASSGEAVTERVSFEAEELEALRVALPALADLNAPSGGDPVDKADASALEGVIAGGLNLLGCGQAIASAVDSQRSLRARIVFGLLAGANCAGLPLRIDAIRDFIGTHAREIEAAADLAACIADIATAATVPINPFFGAVGAGLAVYDCPQAAKKITQLINDRIYAARVTQGFRLVITRGELVAGMDNPVTIELRTETGSPSVADGALGPVVARFGGLGGEGNVPFELRDGVWQWSGQLRPVRAGRHWVPVSIGTRATLQLDIFVLPDRNEIAAQLFASASMVRPGDSAELYVIAQGGEVPYAYFWTEQYDGSAQSMPDLRAVDRFSTVITERVRYAASVSDARWRYADAGDVTIEVCGDGECLPGEREAGCVEDCGGDDARLCQEACAYRAEVLGCGDFPGVCEAVCTAIFTTLDPSRACAELDREYQRCTYSRPALDLGCGVTDGGSVCEPQRTAARRCAESN